METMPTDTFFLHGNHKKGGLTTSIMSMDPIISSEETDNLYDAQMGLFPPTDYAKTTKNNASIYPPLELTTDTLFHFGTTQNTYPTDTRFSPAETSSSSIFTNTNDFSMLDTFGDEQEFFIPDNEHSASMITDRNAEHQHTFEEEAEPLRQASESSDAHIGSPSDSSSIRSVSSSPVPSTKVIPTGRKRGRKPSKLSPEEKRGRRLERGRVAANKCRAKRKEMENKIEDRVSQLLADKQRLIQAGAELMLELEGLKEMARHHSLCSGMETELRKASISTVAVDFDAETKISPSGLDDSSSMGGGSVVKEERTASIEDMEKTLSNTQPISTTS